MSNEPALPPPRVLGATLRKITERLAGELATPTAIPPDWSELEWRLARAVAAMHGVSALLSTRLKWNAPSGWLNFLQAQRTHVVARHSRIEALLSQIDTRARADNIPLVGLKGVALHAAGFYRAGERPMADIDLLVRQRDAAPAVRLLESLGFHEAYSNWKHKVFAPEFHETATDLGEHEQNYLKIELHERVAEALPLLTTDVTETVFPSRPHPGLNAYPSNAALLSHLLIHAAGAMAFRAARLLHLHDIALVSSRMAGSDWDELLQQGSNGSAPWWALPPLQLTGRYFTGAVPLRVIASLNHQCRWPLRQIARRQSVSDVSFSYPWVEAFPGIGWSRSAAEVVKYIAGRIRPSEEVRRLRTVVVETQNAAAQSQWSRMSQRKRVLRWLISRQTRAETLFAVRSALGQART